MARNAQFAAAVEQDDDIEIAEPVTVVNADPGLVRARVKGTWRMYWGARFWDFEDGKYYMLPRDLFQYLRSYSNIYDTM